MTTQDSIQKILMKCRISELSEIHRYVETDKRIRFNKITSNICNSRWTLCRHYLLGR